LETLSKRNPAIFLTPLLSLKTNLDLIGRIFGWCLLGLILVQCKSANKALKSGEYYDAVIIATRKLKESPAHAQSLEVLTNAYPKGLSTHLGAIKKLEANAAGFYWEQIVEHYDKLNRMYAAISQCAACLNAVNAQSFEGEEDRARVSAAAARYAEGARDFELRTRESAKRAYNHFSIASKMKPNYEDVADRLDAALDMATFKVVVEQVQVTSKQYQLSNAYFQDRVNEFLKSDTRSNRFVRFYTPDEAEGLKLKPDHVVRLQFDDFVVGQTLLERNTETVTSKDSVKVGETKVRDKPQPVYGKVTAKFTAAKKTVVSGGVLDLSIVEFATGKRVGQDKLAGEYTWVCEWGSYTGDDRALTSAQKVMVKQQELMPPAPQELFIEFSKPLYDQLTRKLRNFYQSY
jgi:hypothetical protein